ncbi:hypothetical protein [Nocardioides zhouii]|uniref:Uncharacterized protein n=1 Tax=Nocardioides zhouii TaxID=1168729 RepID=A0A4Q2T7M8_9ACTN|nr:hypothetical protein [Nocardioides zhouii]RYC14812.1 hypothetical protein EUA94_01440 [Nocardioides zhouii]
MPTTSISYHVYVGGGPGDPNAIGFNMGLAAVQRDDVARNYPHAGPFHGFGGTVEVPLRGSQPVYVFAINGGGPTDVNQLMGAGTVNISNPLPETTITSGPPAQGTSPTVRFGFTANEASTFLCRIDQAAWSACSSPYVTTVSTYGPHSFQVYATDTEGAADPSPASYAFTVAAPPPPPAPPPVVDPTPPPPPPPTPTITLELRAVKKKSRLRVDIGPDLDPSNYRFTVQRRADGRWRTVKRTQTLGAQDVSIINLPSGRYRVVVPRQHDLAGTRAEARLRR